MSSLRVIISGGGTGGHIFPAVAIANALKAADSECEILFVGARGKMEMEKVPEAGYKIIGLSIRGVQRSLSISNLKVPFLLLGSLRLARKTIKNFKPDVVIGVGGYASAAVVFMASRMGIKTLIQEQNSYPGVTNKILAKRVDRICVAFENMDAFFPKDKIVLTGNPIRQDIFEQKNDSLEAKKHFNLDPSKRTILAIGGSLGARTINNCMLKIAVELKSLNAQILWQCGKTSFETYEASITEISDPNIHLHKFIKRMDLAYSCADLVVSRAGALSVSEITALEKPSILIPSPNVAEDHQTKNASALKEHNAAILLTDIEAESKILNEVKKLFTDESAMNELKTNIKKVFSNKNAASDIALEIQNLVSRNV